MKDNEKSGVKQQWMCSNNLRWDSRGGSRPGPRVPGLQKPWIPGKDLGPG
jgi:hypothetical protein